MTRWLWRLWAHYNRWAGMRYIEQSRRERDGSTEQLFCIAVAAVRERRYRRALRRLADLP